MALKHGIRNGTGDSNWGKDDVDKTNFGQDSNGTGRKARALKFLKGAKAALKKGDKKDAAKKVAKGKPSGKSKKAFALASKKVK